MSETSSPMPTPAALAYAVGIDIGMQACMMCCLTMEKRQVIKPSLFDNTAQGCSWLLTRLEQLGCQPQQILIGLEATSRDARECLPCLAQARLPALVVASRPSPRLLPTTR